MRQAAPASTAPHMSGRGGDGPLLLFTAGLLVACLLLEILFPWVPGGGALYVLPVLLGLRARSRRFVPIVSGSAAALLAAGAMLGEPEVSPVTAVASRLPVLVAIGVGAFLLSRHGRGGELPKGESREITEPRPSEAELEKAGTRLRAQNAVLVALAKSKVLGSGDLEAALSELTKASAHALGCERVGVWRYDEGRTRMRCLDLYELGRGTHSRGIELKAAEFPSYLQALDRERVIAAHDAHRDPRTRELSASYLTPLGIASTLQASLRLGGRMVGVICHEHVGPTRRWRAEEEHFAGSMGDFASLALETWERRRAEEALRASEALKGAILDTAFDAVITMDGEARVMEFNPAAERMFGHRRGDAIGRDLAELVIPPSLRRAHREGLARYLATGEGPVIGRTVELTGQRADGSEFPVEVVIARIPHPGAPVFTGFIRDITERKRAQEELGRREALASLGQMAALVAHEVRNPLAGIGGVVQILGSRLPADSSDRVAVTGVLRRIEALDAKIEGLLRFARPSQPRFAAISVHALLRDTAGLLAADKEMGDVEVSISGEDLTVPGDDDLLKEVFLNLFLNAAEAMDHKGGIRVAVSAGSDRCRIAVRDQGPGVPPQARARVFEPFFTTKPRGTGLGLAIARRVVEDHGGAIEISCPAEGGTTVTVSLRLPRPEPPGS